MAKGKKLLSIIAPCFNEAESLDFFYQSLAEIFDKMSGYSFEVICIDDGSDDNTLSKLLAIRKNDRRFQIIELSRNFGKEAALTAGIVAAQGDAVIPIDVDLQDPPEIIQQMIIEWEKGAEVVLARRVDRSSDTFLKRKSAEMFYRLHNIISSVKIPCNVGDFRLMDRSAVNALTLMPERQRFMKGVFSWVGFKTSVIDYTRNERIAGKTKFSGWKLWNFALEGITSFSITPLRIWTYIGIIGAFLAFTYTAFIIIRTLVIGIEVPGYASLLVFVLFFGSIQLISIGILGEYIGRIYMETKQRPIYIIRKHHGGKNES